MGKRKVSAKNKVVIKQKKRDNVRKMRRITNNGKKQV